MKIKDTLNIGKTKFPMKGNLYFKEIFLQKEWENNFLYNKRQNLNKYKKKFILHDGPPFANGNIHLGHVLNKVSKDIIIRFKSMNGFNTPYILGWDCHGLPIEQMLYKKLGINRKNINILEYRKKCKKYAINQLKLQKEDFKRLGIFCDLEKYYNTLLFDYEASEISVFGKMFKKGYIYRGLKPVYWSVSSESSLAEAEIEYKNINVKSIYFLIKIKNGKKILKNNSFFIVWTTTPWTLPSNMGVVVNSKFIYIVFKFKSNIYIVEKLIFKKIIDFLNWNIKEIEILKYIIGKKLEYIVIEHPIYKNKNFFVMLSEHVKQNIGTGIVHISPGHGEDDYIIGKKYNLRIFSSVNSFGKFNNEFFDLKNIFYEDSNEIIILKLKKNNMLLKTENIIHSYPHDWRTKKPVIFRAIPQWFISIKKIKNKILNEINNVDWINSWGKKRLYKMLKNRNDWVISRQRVWGIPLPIFYAENGDFIITTKTINHIIKLFKKFGSDIWFNWDAKKLLPENFSYFGSPNGKFFKEKDIMDVWFDSGISHEAVLKNKRFGLKFPADLYLEGSDQFRGWFNSSIITSIAINNISPYKAVLSQGFVLDEKSRKMSKSLGNVIEPNLIFKEKGADILRLWVSSVDYKSDVKVSFNILDQISESYRKIRNTIKFMLANISDFIFLKHKISFYNLQSVDKYILLRFKFIVNIILNEGFNKFNFSKVYNIIINFLINDLSTFYLNLVKDIVYIEEKNNHDRRCMQTVIYKILVILIKLLNPIIPHTSEEVWKYLQEKEEYVQLSEFPIYYKFNKKDLFILKSWKNFMKFRNKILVVIEIARNKKIISRSLDSKIYVFIKNTKINLLKNINIIDISKILFISEFIIKDINEYNKKNFINNKNIIIKNEIDYIIILEHADGKLCERCRNFRKSVGINKNCYFKNLCKKCIKIINENFPEISKKGFL